MNTQTIKLLSRVEQCEQRLLADDEVALAGLKIFNAEVMHKSIEALMNTKFDDDTAIGLKIMFIKMLATIDSLEGLTYSMEGRENMMFLRNRVMGSIE